MHPNQTIPIYFQYDLKVVQALLSLSSIKCSPQNTIQNVNKVE
jgi:hypothetical protein